MGSYQRGSSGLEDAKGTIVFLGHLEKDLQLLRNLLWESLRAALTVAVKNACDGCPAVSTQHLRDVLVGETREGFGEFEA